MSTPSARVSALSPSVAQPWALGAKEGLKMDRRSFLKTMRNLAALAAVPPFIMGSKTQEQVAAEQAAIERLRFPLHDPNTGVYRVDVDKLGFFTYHKEDWRRI